MTLPVRHWLTVHRGPVPTDIFDDWMMKSLEEKEEDYPDKKWFWKVKKAKLVFRNFKFYEVSWPPWLKTIPEEDEEEEEDFPDENWMQKVEEARPLFRRFKYNEVSLWPSVQPIPEEDEEEEDEEEEEEEGGTISREEDVEDEEEIETLDLVEETICRPIQHSVKEAWTSMESLQEDSRRYRAGFIMQDIVEQTESVKPFFESNLAKSLVCNKPKLIFLQSSTQNSSTPHW
ncbi:uncharacterized protein [Eleutherodactylus coqui]|uniref:uncharacterized protein n=1 Tax=Eleutherodactylus coqui TaxID=57060 RepID=UPI0034621CDC